MQHVVNIAFDFDDEKVRETARQAVENELDKIIKDIILDYIAPMKRDYLTRKYERDWSGFRERVERITRQALIEEHKNGIIELASSKLCESYKRTKAWKEKTDAAIQD